LQQLPWMPLSPLIPFSVVALLTSSHVTWRKEHL
jgi:hypothetical protein